MLFGENVMVAGRFLIMYHIIRLTDSVHDRLCLLTLKIVEGGIGNEKLQGLKLLFLEKLAYTRGADRLISGLLSGKDDAVNACGRELIGHDLIIDGCDLAEGLISHITAGDRKRLGYPGEDDQIQPGMAFDDCFLVL